MFRKNLLDGREVDLGKWDETRRTEQSRLGVLIGKMSMSIPSALVDSRLRKRVVFRVADSENNAVQTEQFRDAKLISRLLRRPPQIQFSILGLLFSPGLVDLQAPVGTRYALL